jgi:hypothetical protein
MRVEGKGRSLLRGDECELMGMLYNYIPFSGSRSLTSKKSSLFFTSVINKYCLYISLLKWFLLRTSATEKSL